MRKGWLREIEAGVQLADAEFVVRRKQIQDAHPGGIGERTKSLGYDLRIVLPQGGINDAAAIDLLKFDLGHP